MSAKALSHSERRDCLRLSLSENVGPATFRALINRYGSATAALAVLPELSRRGGLSRPIKLYGVAQADEDLERAAAIGTEAVIFGEAAYPEFLRNTDGAPPALWLKGDRDLLKRSAVAIVGSRNASAVGLKFTGILASEIGRAGHVIVSGLARGIDTAAHRASLETGTIAVLASGIDVIYPPENEPLQKTIGERGLLVSEMKPGTVPKAEHFPRRNRIISGLSRAVVVVEAALRSGSLITARLAGEQGREVFAVPGSPLDPRAEGCNKLIREGATLVSRASDILDELSGLREPRRGIFPEPEPLPLFDGDGSSTSQSRSRVASLLSPSPASVDDIVRESGVAAGTVAEVLLELELAGQISRHAGGLVSLN